MQTQNLFTHTHEETRTLKSSSTDPSRPKEKNATYLYGRTYPHGNKQRRIITQVETEIEADPEAQVETVKEIAIPIYHRPYWQFTPGRGFGRWMQASRQSQLRIKRDVGDETFSGSSR